ncbi:HSB-like chaperone-like protein [Pseudoloma neurophilia]|uniref:HSB-like chaperone-like protein n=1 Tax=Pseudoloma neurophilia TaxID=146866 RepID=A0A0R0LWV9_9MICR|nr:HSB-like chaperone-like protein [Pseudoloma neurophilia]
MVQRKSGRRKSIMIVEKDRTQREIDKRPNEEKQNEEKQNEEKQNEEKSNISLSKTEIDKNSEIKKSENEIQKADSKDKIEKKENDKDQKSATCTNESPIDQSTTNKTKDEEKINKKEGEQEDTMVKRVEPEDKNVEEKNTEDKNVEEKNTEEKTSEEKTSEQHPSEQQPTEEKSNERTVHFNETANETAEVPKDPTKSVPSPNLDEIEEKNKKINQEIKESEVNDLKDGGVPPQAASEINLSKQQTLEKKEENTQRTTSENKENTQKIEEQKKEENTQKTTSENKENTQKTKENKKEDSTSKQRDSNQMPKSELDGITGAVPVSDLDPNSELYNLKDNILIEGPARKRMFLCPCFYHSRYYVLTNNGELKYFKNKNKESRNSIKISDQIQLIRRVNETNESFKIFMKFTDDSVESIKYDNEQLRDLWHEKIKQFVRSHENGRME